MIDSDRYRGENPTRPWGGHTPADEQAALGSEEVRVPAGLRRLRAVRTAGMLGPVTVAAVASFTLGGADGGAAAPAIVLAVAIAATAALLRSFPYPLRLMPASRLFFAVAPVLAGGFIAGMLAVSDAYGLAAASLLPATILGVVAAVAVEAIGHRLLAALPLRVAVLGDPAFAEALRSELEADGAQHVQIIGWLNLGESNAAAEPLQIGTIDSIRAVITEHGVDLLVRGPGSGRAEVGRRAYDAIAQGCVDLPVRMIDGNQFYEQLFGHVPLGTIDSNWFLYLMHPSFASTPRVRKRISDLLYASVASLIALPLLALAAILIKLEDRGPIFYRQTRIGAGGRPFRIIKLRTMADRAEVDGARWSSGGDERVTRIGRILRRSHVDELPQLINVLRGEMTMVGPRPERPEIIGEMEQLFPHYGRRMLVKPGVTGWAQVRCGYAGSELGTAWKLCHDLFYLKHRGLFADATIMLETLLIAARDSHRPIRAPQPAFLYQAAGGGATGGSGVGDTDVDTVPVPEIRLGVTA